MQIVEIEPSDTIQSLIGGQSGIYKFSLSDTKSFTVIDVDTSTQDLGLAVWFSNIPYYEQKYFESYLYIQHVQQKKPLIVSVSTTGKTEDTNIVLEAGQYYLNIENRTGSLKSFLLKEINP